MAEEPENLVLVMLRRLDAKFDRFSDDLHNVKIRLSNVEEGLVGLNRRLDRCDTRLDHIEKRLDLVEPPQSGFRE